MSSFIRKTNAGGFEVQGTRIRSAGQLITSSGQADIDGLISGGGFPLGSLVVVLEDDWTQHHYTLCRYFLGQGAVSGHSILLASSQHPPIQLQDFLPMPRDQVPSTSVSDTRRENPTDERNGASSEPQLRIAWQYGKYLRKNQEAVSSSTHDESIKKGEWCHEFDLSKAWGGTAGAEHQSIVLNGREAGEDLVLTTLKFVESLDFREKGNKVGRVAVLSLGSIDWGVGYGCSETGRLIIETLVQLKAAIFLKRCIVMVTVPANALTSSDATRVRHIADICFTLQSHHDPSVSDIIPLVTDAVSVTGIIRLDKFRMAPGLMPSQNASRSPWHLVRQRRKKMDITPMELDPDAEAAAAGGGEVRNSGPVCTPGIGATPSVDF